MLKNGYSKCQEDIAALFPGWRATGEQPRSLPRGKLYLAARQIGEATEYANVWVLHFRAGKAKKHFLAQAHAFRQLRGESVILTIDDIALREERGSCRVYLLTERATPYRQWKKGRGLSPGEERQRQDNLREALRLLGQEKGKPMDEDIWVSSHGYFCLGPAVRRGRPLPALVPAAAFAAGTLLFFAVPRLGLPLPWQDSYPPAGKETSAGASQEPPAVQVPAAWPENAPGTSKAYGVLRPGEPLIITGDGQSENLWFRFQGEKDVYEIHVEGAVAWALYQLGSCSGTIVPENGTSTGWFYETDNAWIWLYRIPAGQNVTIRCELMEP